MYFGCKTTPGDAVWSVLDAESILHSLFDIPERCRDASVDARMHCGKRDELIIY